MNKQTVNKYYQITPEAAEYIKNYAEDNELSSQGAALSEIVRLFQIQLSSGDDADLASLSTRDRELVKAIMDRIQQTYGHDFHRLKFIDFNTQVQMEEINTILQQGNVRDAMTSSYGKSPVWTECEKEVRDQIGKNKEISDNKV